MHRPVAVPAQAAPWPPVLGGLLARPYWVWVVVAMLAHGQGVRFFQYDDWSSLMAYHTGGLGYLFRVYLGHWTPLWKAIYHLEMLIFGPNAPLYFLVNVLLWAGIVRQTQRLVAHATGQSAWGWGVAAVLVVHPGHAFNINALYQVQLLANVWAQVTAAALVLTANPHSRRTQLLVLGLLVVQWLTFGNGAVFGPALAAVAVVRLGWRQWRHPLVWGPVAFTAVALPLTLWAIASFPAAQAAPSFFRHLGQPLYVLDAWRKLFSYHLAHQVWFHRDVPHLLANPHLVHGLGVALWLALAGLALKFRRSRPLALALGAWMLVLATPVAVARAEGLVKGLPAEWYLTTLAMPLLVVPALGLWAGLQTAWAQRLLVHRRPARLGLQVALVTYLLAALWLDRRLAAYRSYEHGANLRAMQRALAQQAPYEPPYDPIVAKFIPFNASAAALAAHPPLVLARQAYEGLARRALLPNLQPDLASREVPTIQRGYDLVRPQRQP